MIEYYPSFVFPPDWEFFNINAIFHLPRILKEKNNSDLAKVNMKFKHRVHVIG